MTLILVYKLSKTILGHSFFNYILVIYENTSLDANPHIPFNAKAIIVHSVARILD